MLEDLKTFVPVEYDDHEPLGKVGLCFKGWGKGEMSAEHRKNLSIAASKRIRSKDHIKKLHEGRRNSSNSQEHINAVVSSRVGTKHSDESKSKMSRAKVGKETTRKAASRGGKAAALKRAADPEYKKAQSEKMKLIWSRRKEGIVNGD